MDSKYILPFVESTNSVFETMVGLDVEISRPHLDHDMSRSHHDVTGIIGMSGDVVGTVVLTFPLATAQAVVDAFVGSPVDPTEEADDFGDAIGELVNMISGAAKGRFEGINVSISCPTVVIGAGHVVTQPSDATCIRIPCRVSKGEFSVDVCIKRAKAATSTNTDASASAA